MGSRLDATSSAVRKRIQNHVFEDEEGEEYEASVFGGFGDYMRRKKAKLQNLDNHIRSAAAQDNCPQIFRTVVAHVNGYTQPSQQDLHKLIVRHGGGFLQYLEGKTAATHIIASSLTPKKREEFRRYRVVKPAWVVESVKAGRLLPWDMFKVIHEGQSQKVLNFDNGRMSSQTATVQATYKDESNSGWYSSEFHREGPSNDEGSGLLKSPTNNQSNNASQSDYGDFPSFTSLDAMAKEASPNEPAAVIEKEEAPAVLPANSGPPRPESPLVTGSRLSPQLGLELPKTDMTSEEYNAQLLSDPRMRSSSVVNPEFLQQYYRESRLHHLSTWKAELKAQLQSRAQEKSRSQLDRKKLVPGARRYIMHVDFDCFFAAVSTLKHPDLEGKPIAIAHGTGTGSEIASCNYVARASGIKNGMWMKSALQACPDLHVLPYDFPAYEEASRKFYRAILAIDGIVQSVSIDEALVDISSLCLEAGGSDGRGVSEGSIYREQAKADEVAETLRASVKTETGCAVSVGIGGNILQAKVALRKAKPAGQFQLKPDAVLDFIAELPVQNLPGVGYSMSAKMEELGVKLVKDIRELSREKLTTNLGPKTGAKLWDYARGIDRTEVGVEVARKSVSAEVNWGIRFVTQDQAEDFVRSLCDELHRRLVENLVKGKQLTFKVMRRAADAPLEPVKHLGHGHCDVFNKSVILGVATNATDVLGKEAVAMLRSLGISPGDLRGLGVQMTKLEPLKSTSEKPDGSQQQLTFKTSPARKTTQRANDPDLLDSPRKGEVESIRHGPSLNDTTQKPLNISGTQFIMPSQSDPAVVAELPSDIRAKLIAQNKRRSDSHTTTSFAPGPGAQPSCSTLPPQSQLDPETLAALPEDVLTEIMGYYNQPAATNSRPATSSSSTAPAPSRPTSSSSNPLRVHKPTTPQKKRRGRPPLKQPPVSSLTQSKFVFQKQDAVNNNGNAPVDDDPNISPDFLAALPEDIRREVLEESKRARLHQRSSTSTTNVLLRPGTARPTQTTERQIRLPPLPERPTFTSKKLSQLTDLRDQASAWYAAFAEDGPFQEDVVALAEYLKCVVIDERDVDKAVSVVKWLTWLIDDEKSFGESPRKAPGSQDGIPWDQALVLLKEGVQRGLEERGLPPVDFTEDYG
ncbi:putative DNA damage repair protein Mus42 [Aspergillus lucknowensis]|uniref:DNA repair protein REV1 n=1 Tax=Aspergillus lucknowensis TaxID=176173 RepID=A0ABR4M2E8_9EURO